MGRGLAIATARAACRVLVVGTLVIGIVVGVVGLVGGADRIHRDRDVSRTAPAPAATPGGTAAGRVLVVVLLAATAAVLVIASTVAHLVAVTAVGVTLVGAGSLVGPSRSVVRARFVE
uniref:hypothetical protein n=1 Tax=Streptomyces blattellae TaxID=2569855 RepID=UPI001E3658A3|nr:hypothetical protein [Streptomyces blattellae]